jgi:hypothetical protein
MIAYDRLQQIIPQDIALANKALAVSLQQIGGITNTTLPALANTISRLQTTRDLPLVEALGQPVPQNVTNFFVSSYGQTANSVNNLNITSIIGTPSGIGYTQPVANSIGNINSMTTTALQSTYKTMLDVVDGVYNVPTETGYYVLITTGPYAGHYDDEDSCFNTALIPGAQSQITSLVAAYPAQTAAMNAGWYSMGQQYLSEQNSQQFANLDFNKLQANSTGATYGFIYSLPTYGENTEKGGVCQYLEAIADISTFTGQSLIACLREGANQTLLRSVGINVSSTIPAAPNPPPLQANLIPSTYSTSEVVNAATQGKIPTQPQPGNPNPSSDPTITLTVSPVSVENNGETSVTIKWYARNSLSVSLTADNLALSIRGLTGQTTIGPWNRQQTPRKIRIVAKANGINGNTAVQSATVTLRGPPAPPSGGG